MANFTITMPDIGDDKPVEVIEILVSAGDKIDEEAGVITIESDKATMDVPAPSAGTLVELKVAIGDQIKVGDEIAVIDQAAADGEPADSAEPAAQSTPPSDETAAPSSADPVPDEQQTTAPPASASTVDITVTMPDIGDDNPVEVIDILVSIGDDLAEESGVITIESDKATMDVPTPSAGSVKALKVSTGDKVKAGDEIAILTQASTKASPQNATEPSANAEIETESPQAAAPENNPPAAEQPPAAKEPPVAPSTGQSNLSDSSRRIYSSPAVRYIAREWGIDLHDVSGSGRNGRILKADMQAYVRSRLAEKPNGGSLPATPQVDHTKFGATRNKPLGKIRKLSATNLHASWVNIPHVTQHYRADITALESARKGHNLLAETKLTPLAYLLKASAILLREMEDFNSSLSNDGASLILKDYVHIGFACDTPNGLVVPVIQDVDKKSLSELATEAGQLAAKARDGKLMPKQMQGGCFTISSLGHIGKGNSGPDYFSPIVNAPQVAILGVSRSKTEPQWNGSEFEPRLMLPLSLSYDHRVIDGVAAAKFTQRLGELLADWQQAG